MSSVGSLFSCCFCGSLAVRCLCPQRKLFPAQLWLVLWFTVILTLWDKSPFHASSQQFFNSLTDYSITLIWRSGFIMLFIKRDHIMLLHSLPPFLTLPQVWGIENAEREILSYSPPTSVLLFTPLPSPSILHLLSSKQRAGDAESSDWWMNPTALPHLSLGPCCQNSCPVSVKAGSVD